MPSGSESVSPATCGPANGRLKDRRDRAAYRDLAMRVEVMPTCTQIVLTWKSLRGTVIRPLALNTPYPATYGYYVIVT